MRALLQFCLAGAVCLAAACGRSGAAGGDDSFAEGWRKYGYGAYDAAAAIFERRAVRAADGSPEQLEALYAEATVWNLRRPGEDPDRARTLYRRVLALGPETEFAAWSDLALARMDALGTPDQLPDPRTGLAAFTATAARYPGRLAGEEALIHEATALLIRWRPDDARAARARLEAFVAAHPRSIFIATAHGLLAECAHVLGEPERRLAETIAAYERRETDARRQWERHPAGEFRFNDGETFQIADLAEHEVGDFATARRFYGLFLELNPTEKRGYNARQALARMDRVEAQLRAGPPAP